MIRDICFESCESVYADEPNDFEYLFSGDVDGDGTTETVLSALSGDILVLRVRVANDLGDIRCSIVLISILYSSGEPSNSSG